MLFCQLSQGWFFLIHFTNKIGGDQVDMMKIEPYRLYTIQQLVSRLFFSSETIRRMCRSGDIPAKKVNGQWRVLGYHLLRYFEQEASQEADHRLEVV